MITHSKKAFTLIELLATITIMAVLIVAALPYVADYSSWARSTSEKRDSEVIRDAINRWVAVGGAVTTWTIAHPNAAWTSGGKAAKIINDLCAGWTVQPAGTPTGPKQPFLAPNTAFTAVGLRVKIAFTSTRNYTVMGRSE